MAARPLRELLREEHDEIAAAMRVLREAEKAHNHEIELAQRQLRSARTAQPLDSYGHEVILYADRLSTADGNHPLTPGVRARIEGRVLAIEGPGWRREIGFAHRDERKLRRLAEEIEAAARNVETIHRAVETKTEHAEQVLGGAWADRQAVEETRALVHKLGRLVHEGEDVLDMAPGISAGHDGVLVATDRRVLFVSVRRILSFPYEEVSAVSVKGKWFGARLALSTDRGKGVISGIAPGHAAAIADMVRSRLPAAV